MINSWTFFRFGGGEVIRGQPHQSSGSCWSGVYTSVGSIELTSPPSGSFSICKIAQSTGLRILPIALGEELKVLNFV